MLVRETNLYTLQKVATKPDPNLRDMEKDKMKAYLGIYVHMSAVELPETQMYWAKDFCLAVLILQQSFQRIGLIKYHSIFMRTTKCHATKCTEKTSRQTISCQVSFGADRI